MIRNHAPSVGHQRNLKAVEINFEKMTRNITILKSLVRPKPSNPWLSEHYRHYGLQNLLTLSKAYIPEERERSSTQDRSPPRQQLKAMRPRQKPTYWGKGKLGED